MTTPKELLDTPSKRICPASFGNLGRPPPKANKNVPPLRRWQATWRALDAELSGGPSPDPPEEQFDPVQAAIVAAQIKRAKPLLPASGRGEIDLDWPHLTVAIGSEELKVFFQFTREGTDGRLEMYKLKTGKIDEETEFATAPEEIATVVTDPRFPDSLEAYEIRTADGEMIRLEMPKHEARAVLSKLELDYQQMASFDPDEIVEGAHCSMCKVADLCMAFPRIDPRSEKVTPRRPLPAAFQLMISKSRLQEMDYCERRAAWRVLYSIPPDLDYAYREASPGLEAGKKFHHLMARALLSDDPAGFFSKDLEMETLYQQHLSLPCTPGLDFKLTEFPLGLTVRFRTDQHSVAVVLYGIADGVGREADGTPAIIDHKTGRSAEAIPYEAELYALGAFLRLRQPPTVATHIHQLAIGKDPICERKVWDRDQMSELASQLVRVAETAAGWDLRDATSPPYRVGEWCGTCPFEQRCRSHR